MSRLYGDTNKFEDSGGPPLVEAFHTAIRDLFRRKWEQSGLSWSEFVFGPSYELVDANELAAIDARMLSTGYRYAWSAVISAVERPDAYRPVAGRVDGGLFSFEHAEARVEGPDSEGRELRGQGDNVVQYPANLVGIARYFRSVQDVMGCLTNGVPANTVAIIDDSGGTLTAPILEHFAGVICAGGTVRSHLGILTREYGIPCFMNARVSGILEGDRVEMEVAAPAKTTEAYQQGREMAARVWKLPPG